MAHQKHGKNIRNSEIKLIMDLNRRKKYYQRQQISKCDGNSKKTWKTIKSIFNWKNNGSPSRLFHNGNLYTKNQEIADCQNEFFMKKIQKIESGLPQAKSDPLRLLKDIMKNNESKMNLSTVHPDEVLNIISKLSNSSAFGLDGIDSYTLKLAKESVTPVLTHIINLSIMTRTYPEMWKKAKLCHFTKKMIH